MFNWFGKKIKNKKGFTLVELIVVIAILSILAAIAVPKFTDVTDSAAIGAAEANHRTLVSAVLMAQIQAGGDLPEASGKDDGFTGMDNLLDFIQGGKATLTMDGVTYSWTDQVLTTTINKTSKKYEPATKGNVVITKEDKNTVFTTTFE